MWPNLPPSLQLNDPETYMQTRELPARVCRDLNATPQDELLEILWLGAFRSRLVEKWQHVAMVLQNKSWFEIARY